MTVCATPPARLQLQAAIGALARRDADGATEFVREIVALLSDRAAVEREATSIAEFAGLPSREIVVRGVRLFFRAERETLWLVGVWPAFAVA